MFPKLGGVLAFSLFCLQSFGSAQSTREQFASLAASHGGIIKLNSKTFDAITAPERDWSVAVQMTAVAGHSVKCEPCLAFAPNFEAVGKSWKKVPKDSRDAHFFATLDFKDGPDIFKRLGMNSAPFVHFYPATKGPLVDAHPSVNMWTYDFSTNSFDADVFAERLSAHTPVPIPYTPPLNYRLIFTVVGMIATLFIGYQVLGPVILAVLSSRWIWGLFSLAFIVTMLGGFMFVKVRFSPWAGQVRGPQGQPVLTYIAPGYQNQYGAENWMISGIYSLLAVSQIALISFAPIIPSASRQRAAVIVWLAVSWMLFSVLVAIFRLKHSGYPFKLLL